VAQALFRATDPKLAGMENRFQNICRFKNGEVLRGRKKYVSKKPVKTTVFRHLPASHQLVKGELTFCDQKTIIYAHV
jgi:hypothetical protein